MKRMECSMSRPYKHHLWRFTVLIAILLMSLAIPVITGENASQSTMPPSLALLGAGARWAARDGTSALYVNWEDNWKAHHLTDGGNWVWFPESAMTNWRSSITNALQQSGFEVTFAGDIPDNLDSYDLLVLFAYYAIEPRHEPLIRDYISNGGSVVMLAGAPCLLTTYSKILSTSNDLTPIQEWLGCSLYANSGGTARPAFDNPFGTSLSTSDILFTGTPSHAGVTSLNEDARVIAFWSTSAVFAFTHEYGDGRVYYQAIFETQTSIDNTPSTDSARNSTSISIATDTLSSFLGFPVVVYGTLNDTLGNGLSNEPVFFYYTFPDFGSWIPVTSDATDEFGRYDINWIPPATGSFILKAEWKGNSTHSGSSDILSLSITPYKNEQVFSVESNSTVSALAFNSTSLELNFRVSGPDDTEGYVKFTVAKSIVSDVTNIRVYLDGNNLDYSASSLGDSWLLIFTYTHSTHDVAINLGVQSQQQQSGFLGSDLPIEYGCAVVIAVAVAVIGVGLLVYFKKRKH
jgi:hypothetical protein